MIGWSQESASELQDRPSGDRSKLVWKEAHDLGLFTLGDHNQGLGRHEVLANPRTLPVFLWLGPKWLSLARRGREEDYTQKLRETLGCLSLRSGWHLIGTQTFSSFPPHLLPTSTSWGLRPPRPSSHRALVSDWLEQAESESC